MSLIAHTRISPIRPRTILSIRRITARSLALARRRFKHFKPYMEPAATILLFTAIMAVLLGVKAAIVLSRMPNWGQ
jgi:hypothetical protein